MNGPGNAHRVTTRREGMRNTQVVRRNVTKDNNGEK